MAMKRIAAMLLASVLLLSCVGCAQDGRKEPDAEKTDLGLTAEVKPATDFTAKANAAVYDELDFDDKQEYEFATRGLIDAPETLELKDGDGTILWSQEAYAFLDDYEKAPDSVNPSLWENTKNNHAYGLFEVTDGIYQVRGYDMANLTVVKGDTGWIVFDTLMSVECSQAAMQLIEKNLGKFPVKAVIISHSHADHFGGIAGVMAKEDKADETLSIEDQLASGKIPVITPVGFTEHSVKENVYAGKGMGRRSNYQYGILLTPGVTGKLAQGIGMGQSTGTVSFMTPSYEITQSGEKLTIDGVELEFQLTPGTEAPAEMNTWLPQYKALWMAENCTGTLHKTVVHFQAHAQRLTAICRDIFAPGDAGNVVVLIKVPLVGAAGQVEPRCTGKIDQIVQLSALVQKGLLGFAFGTGGAAEAVQIALLRQRDDVELLAAGLQVGEAGHALVQ